MVPVAVFSRLLQALGLVQDDPRAEFQEALSLTIVRLDDLESRVDEIEFRLESRATQLFEKIVTLLRRGERSQAAIYAGELSQIRSVVKLIKAFKNLVIMTKERLKTVKDMSELSEVLMVFGTAIEGIKDRAVAIQPNLSMMFDEISKNVNNLIIETSMGNINRIDPITISNEAMEIMNEALKRAEESVREEFPDPPLAPVIPAKAAAQAEAVAAAANGGGGAVAYAAPQPTAPRTAAPGPAAGRQRSLEEVEQLVLDYIRRHDGYLDVRDFTTRYQVDKNTLLQALHRLAEKGLIRIH